MPEMSWIFVIENKIKQTLTGFEMAATEIHVMITVSGNFFPALRWDHRQLYIHQTRAAVLLAGWFVFVFVLCVSVVLK